MLAQVRGPVTVVLAPAAVNGEFPEDPPFDRRLQEAEFDFLAGSKAAQAALAENYVGLAY